jgi:hypothetical protein
MKSIRLYTVLFFLFQAGICIAQQAVDSSQKTPQRKNVIRYNLSGGLLFGFDKYIVIGYERVLSPRQSISINVGRASFPKLITVVTDSFNVEKDASRSGANASIDYRFYLAKENKYEAPRGVYIGPYYSYNHLTSETRWDYKSSGSSRFVDVNSTFNIHTVGFELGYQFILWKRLALDMVLVGPGLGFYNYKATFDHNIDGASKEQLLDALEQLLTQKFPGMNYVFSDKHIDSNGTLKTNNIGYRYIVHIGYNF